MTATLDYSSYPHIFRAIMEHCHWRVQNDLRLLSSSVKDDVDRYQCRYVCISSPLDLDEEVADGGIATALSKPRGVSFNPGWIFTPLLCRDLATKARNGPWALRNARHVEVSEVELLVAKAGHDASTPNHLWLLERCTDLTFFCSLSNLKVRPHRLLAVPTFIQHLHVMLVTVYHNWNITPRVDLTHSCRKVTVKLEEQSKLLEGLETIKGLLHPGVEHLVLVVSEPSVVTPYLHAIKEELLHPCLLITIQVVQPAELQSLSNDWAQLIDAKIEVQKSEAVLRYF